MAEVICATWDDLKVIVAAASQKLTVCTPFFSAEGVAILFDYLPLASKLVFITRLSPSDWLHGVSDPDALATLLEILNEKHERIFLTIHQRLHAKAYLADESIGLVGSANLSVGGFDTNFELMVRLGAEEVGKAHTIIQQEVERYGRHLSAEDLRTWVNSNSSRIKQLQSAEDVEAEQLADMQRSLDTILGWGNHTRSRSSFTRSDLSQFVTWLEEHPGLPGATVLLSRYLNADGQNLTGHFRQSFFGVAHFISEHSLFVGTLSHELESLKQADVFQPQGNLLSAWVEHMDLHSTDQGENYDYAVLRGILPPNLGGTRQGGGGGSSTLKRMLPLVARFTEREMS